MEKGEEIHSIYYRNRRRALIFATTGLLITLGSVVCGDFKEYNGSQEDQKARTSLHTLQEKPRGEDPTISPLEDSILGLEKSPKYFFGGILITGASLLYMRFNYARRQKKLKALRQNI